MLSIFLVTMVTASVTGELTSVVRTTAGPVQGEILESHFNSIRYAAFKGIRYGNPPVGYHRFKPAIPADPWEDVVNATTEATHCSRFEFGSFHGTEDCLFLNVFTPVINLEATPKKLKSVIIYVYGGAWMTGASKISTYGPDFMIERDIVLITFNYRSGAFGFLSLNHPNATGNAGLKDQTLVFKWVRANIENFGGNPKNVTIMGASSGGMSIGYHMISDASVGLFHGAICMSGAPLMPWGFSIPAKAFLVAKKIGMMIGAKNTDKESLLEAFYSAPAATIAHATHSLAEIVSWAPTIENASIATDVFLSKCSVQKYFRGNFTKVPVILGFMDHETISYATCKNQDMESYRRLVSNAMDIITLIGADMPQNLRMFRNIADNMNFENMTQDESTLFEATIYETTGILFITPIDLTHRLLVVNNKAKPLYYYHISFTMDDGPHSVVSSCLMKAAGHADDIALLFYSTYTKYKLDPKDRLMQTIYRVTTMWTNFAKYGNPTPDWVDEYPLNITWPKSGLQGFSLNIGDELVVERRPISNYVRDIETAYWPFVFKLNGCH